MRFKISDHVFDRIRQEYVNFLNEMDLRYFVTLNFRGLRDKGLANQILSRFIKELNVALFGKRSKNAIRCVPSIERHAAGSCHIHILFDDPCPRINDGAGRISTEDEFKELVRKVWEGVDDRTASIRSSCPDGSSWFKRIDDQEGALGYIAKQIGGFEQDAIQSDLINKSGRRQ